MGIGNLFKRGAAVQSGSTVSAVGRHDVFNPSALIADEDGQTMIGIIRDLHARPPGELIYSDAHRDLTLTFQPTLPEAEPVVVRVRSFVITRSTRFAECYTVRFHDGVVVIEWRDGTLMLRQPAC